MNEKLVIKRSVGKNRPKDVKAVAAALVRIGKITDASYASKEKMDEMIQNAIIATQRLWTDKPDGIIDVNGTTNKYINIWDNDKKDNIDPSCNFSTHKKLEEAWELISPILPKDSKCTSAYRTTEHQRKVLRNYLARWKIDILDHKDKKTGEIKYSTEEYSNVYKNLLTDPAKYEDKAMEMVKAVNIQIAKPGTSAHEKGKAFDVGGTSTLNERHQVILKIVKANPTIFNAGKLKKEREQNCIHVEIK